MEDHEADADGDGDLGVRPNEVEISKIYYTWYKKLPDMTYELYQFANDKTTIPTDIPYDEVMNKEEAQNKVLRGIIEVELDTPWKQGLDTMCVDFYITDRARHESNIERTPDFSIKDPSVPVD